VEVVESFPYLGSLIHCTGDSVLEIKRTVLITRDCMMALDRNIWRSSISVGIKLRLYNSCILPIFLNGAETWAVTATAANTFYALDQWCLRRILNIHWTERITNNEVRSRTQKPLVSDAVRPDAFVSLVTSAELTPIRIILWHCTPVLACRSTGGEDPAGRDRPGYELSRMIYGHSIWVWRQLNGVRRTEQLGRHSGNGYVADKLRMMMIMMMMDTISSFGIIHRLAFLNARSNAVK